MIVGGLEVGIAGIGQIMDDTLEYIDESDEVQKKVLLARLKTHNYVPSSSEAEYLRALWPEYKKLRVQRREQLECTYKGIPRESIPWYPKVDPKKCTGCTSCVEFCSQGVFTFDGVSRVTKPYKCVVGKTSCRSFCPEKAIIFPTHSELKETLAKLRERYSLKE